MTVAELIVRLGELPAGKQVELNMIDEDRWRVEDVIFEPGDEVVVLVTGRAR